jgi:hypothetical protein
MDSTSRQSQISIYILVGLIILVLVGIMLYIRQIQIESFKPDSIAEDFPLEVRPVKQAVEDCLRKVSHEAFDLLGQHGGYLDPTDPDLSKKTFFFNLDEPVEGDGVTIFDESNAIPYWFYVPENNGASSLTITNKHIPTINHIDNQLRHYVLTEITACFDQYRTFSLQGLNVTELPGRFVTFEYAKDAVFLDLTYPLKVTWGVDGEFVTRLEEFKSELPFNFMDVFGVAFALSQSLIATQALEDATMHAMVLYSGLDKNKLPPFSADQVNGEEKVVWSLDSVKKRLKDVISLSANLFQVAGLKDSELIDVSGSPGLLKPFFFDLFQSHDILKRYNVEFIYLDWPIYSNIWPTNDDKLIPQTIKGPDFFDVITGQTTYKYRFFYDVSYPVLIRVVLEDIPFKDGRDSFSFYFAHEVNLRRNLNLLDYLEGKGRVPLNPKDVEMDTELIDEQIQTEMELSGEEKFLEQLESDIMTKKAENSLFCDSDQRISPPRLFDVYDMYTDEPLSGVEMHFVCGRYVNCKWDGLVTEKDLVTLRATLETTLPLCRGEAYAVFLKEGYLKKRVKVNTEYPHELDTYKVEMIPKFEVSVNEIVIRDSNNFTNTRLLGDGEFASVKFERILDHDPFGELVSTSITVRADDPVVHKIVLAPGLWKVEGRLIDEEGYYIDAARRCDCGKDGSDMVKICESENETLRQGVPDNCKVKDEFQDGEAVKLCECLFVNGSVDVEGNEICNEVKDIKLWYFGNETVEADCEVVQDFVPDFTHIGPSAEVGGVYMTGKGYSVYWDVSYNALAGNSGLKVRLIEFPKAKDDNDVELLNIRGAFVMHSNYAYFGKPVFT